VCVFVCLRFVQKVEKKNSQKLTKMLTKKKRQQKKNKTSKHPYRNASVIWLVFAPPPTSRKLAGVPL